MNAGELNDIKLKATMLKLPFSAETQAKWAKIPFAYNVVERIDPDEAKALGFETCGCVACQRDGTHDSDCAVHGPPAEPFGPSAEPLGPCTCGAKEAFDADVRSGLVHCVHFLVKLCMSNPTDLDVKRFAFVLGGLVNQGIPGKVLVPPFSMALNGGRSSIGCYFSVHMPGKNFDETRDALNEKLGFKAFVNEGEVGEVWNHWSLPG